MISSTYCRGLIRKLAIAASGVAVWFAACSEPATTPPSPDLFAREYSPRTTGRLHGMSLETALLQDRRILLNDEITQIRALWAVVPGIGKLLEQGDRGTTHFSIEHSADFATGGPRIGDGEVALRSLDFALDTGVGIDLRGYGASRGAFVLELNGPILPEYLADGAKLLDAIRASLLRKHEFVAHADGSPPRCAFVPRAECRSLLIGVIGSEAGFTLTGLSAHAFSRLATTLMRDTSGAATLDDPRPIDLEGSFRHAVLIGVPGALSFSVPSAATQRRLLFSAAKIDDGETTLTIRLDVANTSTQIAAMAIETPRSRWAEQSCTLPPLSQSGTLTLLVTSTANSGAATNAVAIAAPRLETLQLAQPVPPSVIVVSLDTVRADHLEPYGSRWPTSPNFKRLAERGTLFENAFTAATYTLPSHGSIFSGQLPDHHGVITQSQRLRTDTPLLAEILHRSGRRTLAFTGGGFVHPDFGFVRGFDRYEILDAAGEVRSSRDARQLATSILDDLIATLKKDEYPSFTFLHTYAAHNYSAPEDHVRAVGGDPNAIQAMLRGIRGEDLLSQIKNLGRTDADRENIRALYRASVRVADDYLGHVIDALDQSQRWRSTLLIVLSDHGEELYEHADFGHGHHVHDELSRVPLLMVGPNIPARRIADNVSTLDVLPTILDYCGISTEGLELDGVSLLPRLRDEPWRRDPPIVRADSRTGATYRALIGEREKVVVEERDGLLVRIEVSRRNPSGGWDPVTWEDGAARMSSVMSHVRSLMDMLRSSAIVGDTRATSAVDEQLRQLGY